MVPQSFVVAYALPPVFCASALCILAAHANTSRPSSAWKQPTRTVAFLIKWLRSRLTCPLLRITLVISSVSPSSSYLDMIPMRIMFVGGMKQNFGNDKSLEWDVATSIKTLMVGKKRRVAEPRVQNDHQDRSILPQSACEPVRIPSPVNASTFYQIAFTWLARWLA